MSLSRSSSGSKKFINEKEYLTNIYQAFYNPNFEICGNITINSSANEFIDFDYNVIDAEKTEKEYQKSLEDKQKHKLMCVHERYSEVMWHTHPSIVYPSIQDVAFVLKRPFVNYSYIVTNIGYFKITALNKKPIILNERDIEHLSRALHEYYFFDETKKGRVYNKERMNTYISHLNTKFNQILENYDNELYFQIKFYKYI